MASARIFSGVFNAVNIVLLKKSPMVPSTILTVRKLIKAVYTDVFIFL